MHLFTADERRKREGQPAFNPTGDRKESKDHSQEKEKKEGKRTNSSIHLIRAEKEGGERKRGVEFALRIPFRNQRTRGKKKGRKIRNRGRGKKKRKRTATIILLLLTLHKARRKGGETAKPQFSFTLLTLTGEKGEKGGEIKGGEEENGGSCNSNTFTLNPRGKGEGRGKDQPPLSPPFLLPNVEKGGGDGPSWWGRGKGERVE